MRALTRLTDCNRNRSSILTRRVGHAEIFVLSIKPRALLLGSVNSNVVVRGETGAFDEYVSVGTGSWGRFVEQISQSGFQLSVRLKQTPARADPVAAERTIALGQSGARFPVRVALAPFPFFIKNVEVKERDRLSAGEGQEFRDESALVFRTGNGFSEG